MKKSILSFLILMLFVPVMFFTGCSNKTKLPEIKASRYFSSSVSTSLFDQTQKRQIQLSSITSKKPNKDHMDKYVQYELTGDGVWIYKMYIECIYFYVYTSDTNEAMTITLTFTNLASESDLTKQETVTKTCAVQPGKNKATLCKINIGKVVATATNTKLTIDIAQTASYDFFENNFKWMIYDFSVYGESRSYSGK